MKEISVNNIGGIKNLISHGRILDRPSRQPFGTQNSVGYELGRCFQLDRDHCLLVASMDEQGGGDLCVGNDGFIFQRLSDIQASNAISLNFPDPNYSLKRHKGTAYLAKYPITGGFVPLDAKLENGQPHPAAGTGIFVSTGMTFAPDRASANQNSELVFEFMQIRWDGRFLKITERTLMDYALGLTLSGVCISYFCPDGPDFLAPLTTNQGTTIYRFAYDGTGWRIVARGEPFMEHHGTNGIVSCGETEPSLQRISECFVLYTRGADPVGRVYRSADGLKFTKWFERRNLMVPQVLNQGLDGSLYLATNPNWDMLRNPLVVYPMIDETFREPLVIHDQDGIRDDKGPSVPFVDHAVGVNLFLEGRWRHLLWYRVCDLKERTFHCFQKEVSKEFHKDGKPAARSPIGGLYLAELEYEQIRQSI
jgi:hypothetical protein